VLLVDQRGTGGSNPLYCAELSLHQVSSLPPRFPAPEVEACRARLAAHAALDHYTTADAAEDLDAVRRALGYETLNLFGSSYGTRVVLEYLRRHSAHVRSAMLWGVVPPGFQRPLWYPRDGQAAFDRLVADCAREPTCQRAFPAITKELHRLLARLDTTPVPITLTDPSTQRAVAQANGLRGAECLDTLFAQFLATPDPKALRTDCVARIRPPESALPPARE
jgi:pimeloyl-ACP methyl ester carboxylesterase